MKLLNESERGVIIIRHFVPLTILRIKFFWTLNNLNNPVTKVIFMKLCSVFKVCDICVSSYFLVITLTWHFVIDRFWRRFVELSFDKSKWAQERTNMITCSKVNTMGIVLLSSHLQEKVNVTWKYQETSTFAWDSGPLFHLWMT